MLKIIWKCQPCTVQEAAEALGEGYARTTVLTIIQRLCSKGYLARRKSEGVFRYRTQADRTKILSGMVRRFVDTVLDKSPLPMMAYLAESEELTAQQAASLRRIIEELEKQEKEKKS